MPISDCDVRDPRIRRTRQLLQGALQGLMQTKGFEEITVQDITEAATVNRATFYDHYADKFALLEAMVAGGFHRLVHERSVTFDCTHPEAIGAIVLSACDYLTLAHAGACSHERQNAFQPLMDVAIATAIGRILIQGMPPASNFGLSVDMIAASASWAIYGAVKQWFFTPGHLPAEEIIQPVFDLILPMLEEAGVIKQTACPIARNPGQTR